MRWLRYIRRKQLPEVPGGAARAGEHRRRDRQPRHHVRQDSGHALRTKVRRHQVPGHGLLPPSVPIHLPRRPDGRGGGARVAAEESLQTAGAQSIYVCLGWHHVGIHLVHHFLAVLLQRTSPENCLSQRPQLAVLRIII